MKDSEPLKIIRQLLNSKADEEIMKFVKDNPKFGEADVYAKKAVHTIFENQPTDAMANFIYLILVNYYSYRYLLNTLAQVEKNLSKKT